MCSLKTLRLAGELRQRVKWEWRSRDGQRIRTEPGIWVFYYSYYIPKPHVLLSEEGKGLPDPWDKKLHTSSLLLIGKKKW